MKALWILKERGNWHVDKRKAKEQELFQEINKSIGSEVLKNRLKYLLEWYDSKAQWNRNCYNILRSLSILLPSVVAALSLFSFLGGEKIIAAFSGLISLAAAYLSHLLDQYRFYESWIRYRSTAETLKSEIFLCLGGCTPYCGSQSEREHQLFVKTEEIAREETTNWQNLRKKQAEKSSESPISPQK